MNSQNTTAIKFGQHLRKLRTEKNLSQEGFALKIGMDRTYYSGIERGNRNPSLQNIQKIADGYGVSLSELFQGV